MRGILRLWRRLRPLLPAALVVAGAPACRRGDGPLVAFLGDSLTSGYRLPEDEAYPSLVARTLAARGRPIRALNAGRSGDTVAQGLARLPRVLSARPDVIVIALGINDALRGLPLDEAEAGLDRLVRESQAAGARVLLVGVRLPTPAEETRAREVMDLYPRVAGARTVPLVPDLLQGVAGRGDLLLPDGLHPNAEGQKRLAATVTPHLELLLAGLEASGRH